MIPGNRSRNVVTERSVIHASPFPATVESIADDLARLGVERGATVLVHSSLSALGWVCGGPVAVVLALEAAVGAGGTVVMPTHSNGWSEPSAWGNPPVPEEWWDTIRATMPAYDPALTPTSLGCIPECFRTQPGVARSGHPHYSFAAWGRHADLLTKNHPLDFGLGEDSPLAGLYDLDALVLLLGVDHSSNTSLHLAEYRADYRGKRVVANAAPMLVEGAREWVEIKELDLISDDFPAAGAAFEAAGAMVRRGTVGIAPTRLMSQCGLVDFGVPWLEENR